MKIFIIVLVAMCCVGGRAKPAPTHSAVPDPAADIAAAAEVIPGLGNIPGAPAPDSSPCASAGTTTSGTKPPVSLPAGTNTSPCASNGASEGTKQPISPPAGLPSNPDLSKPADCSTNPLETAREAPSGLVGLIDTSLKGVDVVAKTASNLIGDVIGFAPPAAPSSLPTWGL